MFVMPLKGRMYKDHRRWTVDHGLPKVIVRGCEMLYSVHTNIHFTKGDSAMADSVYKVIELVGTSTESWEKAAAVAVERASKSLRELRIAEIVLLDMQLEDGKIIAYRAKIKVSFKYEGGE